MTRWTPSPARPPRSRYAKPTEAVPESGPSPGIRSDQLVQGALRRLDEATQVLSGTISAQDLADALDRIAQVRSDLARIARRATPTAPEDVMVLVRRLELPARVTSARAARAFCRRTWVDWSLPPTTASAATDVASELVMNAVEHGAGPVVLELRLGRQQLSVSAYDHGAGQPQLRPFRPGISSRGLGLHLVTHLSASWGWTEERGGKWVWAHIALSRAVDAVPDNGLRRLGRSLAGDRSRADRSRADGIG